LRWLLLDAGNTALKWEVFPAAAAQWPDSRATPPPPRWQGTIAIDDPGLPAELARACAAMSALTGTAVPDAVLGCAVTSDARIRAIEAAIRAVNAPAVRWLAAEAQFDHDGIRLSNGYRDPAQLGADRWHALIGARAQYARSPLAVISAGTATTVDGVAADGRFLGGVIAPGVELMRASLADGTARLPLGDGQYAPHPDETHDAITTGVLDAQVGLIERRVRRIRETTGASVQVVLSGGMAATLFPLLRNLSGFGKLAHEPDLVLRGLWHRARGLAADAISQPAA
jgi:type III pantothenate kinase